MSSMFAPAHFSCSHSTTLTLISSSSIPSSRTTCQVTLPINNHCATRTHWRLWSLWVNLPPPQVVSPTWSTTSTTQRLLKSFSKRSPAVRCPRTCMTRSSVTRPSAKRYLHHCSPQEGEEPAGRSQTYHSFEESLLPSQSSSVCRVITVRPVHELSSLSSCSREKSSREMEDMQKSHVLKSQGTFRKKIDWRLPSSRSNFILPGLQCQDSLQPWWQGRKVPRCWDWRRAHQEFAGFTTVPSGARSKYEPIVG